jgi:thioredoxin-related protein
MKLKWFGFLLGALVISLASISTAYSVPFDDSEIMRVEYPDWFSDDPFYDLQVALREAKAEGKQGLMVLLATQGCSYASVFIRKSLGDPEIAARVQDNFVATGLEIFDDADMTGVEGNAMRVVQFARQQQAEFSPTLLFFDLTGQRILRVTGYQSTDRFRMILDYVTGKHYQSESLPDYIAQLSGDTSKGLVDANVKDLVPSGNLTAVPGYRPAPTEKPLLVLFEKDGCRECEELHASVLSLPEVSDLLARFDVVQLNVNEATTSVQMPDGRRLTPTDWYREAGFAHVPALQFFDPRGNEVLKTDALVLRQRMMNSMYFVLDQAYKKGWSYQRLARSKAIERHRKKQ